MIRKLDQRCIEMNKRNDILTALLGVAVGLILWVTILSRGKVIGVQVPFRPFNALVTFMQDMQNGRISMNFIGNIILFIPVGVLLPMVMGWEQPWKTMATGTGFSLLIEGIQFITAKGCFDLDDVLLNCVGTIIGYIGYWLLIKKRLLVQLIHLFDKSIHHSRKHDEME